MRNEERQKYAESKKNVYMKPERWKVKKRESQKG